MPNTIKMTKMRMPMATNHIRANGFFAGLAYSSGGGVTSAVFRSDLELNDYANRRAAPRVV
ncbi:MAG TPA: hypothetical protein VH475_11115 [Tepidisphaeraceae bacterium]|jgi:hypothetical protein